MSLTELDKILGNKPNQTKIVSKSSGLAELDKILASPKPIKSVSKSSGLVALDKILAKPNVEKKPNYDSKEGRFYNRDSNIVNNAFKDLSDNVQGASFLIAKGVNALGDSAKFVLGDDKTKKEIFNNKLKPAVKSFNKAGGLKGVAKSAIKSSLADIGQVNPNTKKVEFSGKQFAKSVVAHPLNTALNVADLAVGTHGAYKAGKVIENASKIAAKAGEKGTIGTIKNIPKARTIAKRAEVMNRFNANLKTKNINEKYNNAMDIAKATAQQKIRKSVKPLDKLSGGGYHAVAKAQMSGGGIAKNVNHMKADVMLDELPQIKKAIKSLKNVSKKSTDLAKEHKIYKDSTLESNPIKQKYVFDKIQADFAKQDKKALAYEFELKYKKPATGGDLFNHFYDKNAHKFDKIKDIGTNSELYNKTKKEIDSMSKKDRPFYLKHSYSKDQKSKVFEIAEERTEKEKALQIKKYGIGTKVDLKTAVSKTVSESSTRKAHENYLDDFLSSNGEKLDNLNNLKDGHIVLSKKKLRQGYTHSDIKQGIKAELAANDTGFFDDNKISSSVYNAKKLPTEQIKEVPAFRSKTNIYKNKLIKMKAKSYNKRLNALESMNENMKNQYKDYLDSVNDNEIGRTITKKRFIGQKPKELNIPEKIISKKGITRQVKTGKTTFEKQKIDNEFYQIPIKKYKEFKSLYHNPSADALEYMLGPLNKLFSRNVLMSGNYPALNAIGNTTFNAIEGVKAKDYKVANRLLKGETRATLGIGKAKKSRLIPEQIKSLENLADHQKSSIKSILKSVPVVGDKLQKVADVPGIKQAFELDDKVTDKWFKGNSAFEKKHFAANYIKQARELATAELAGKGNLKPNNKQILLRMREYSKNPVKSQALLTETYKTLGDYVHSSPGMRRVKALAPFIKYPVNTAKIINHQMKKNPLRAGLVRRANLAGAKGADKQEQELKNKGIATQDFNRYNAVKTDNKSKMLKGKKGSVISTNAGKYNSFGFAGGIADDVVNMNPVSTARGLVPMLDNILGPITQTNSFGVSLTAPKEGIKKYVRGAKAEWTKKEMALYILSNAARKYTRLGGLERVGAYAGGNKYKAYDSRILTANEKRERPKFDIIPSQIAGFIGLPSTQLIYRKERNQKNKKK